MSDPKLTAQMLDLSRNIEKLTGAVKSNTESSENLDKSNKESEKGLKETISKLGGDIKSLDFKSLSKDLGGLKDLTKGFEGVTKSIKDLDFKKVGEDFKNVAKSFGDIKSLKDIPKSFDEIKDLTKNFEGVAKSLKGAEKIKSVVSGDTGKKIKGFGKKILGAFEDGGPVNQTGEYLVGERGPEIVKLESGSNVIPNEKIVTADQKLSEKIGPNEKQIEKYRQHLLNEYPDYYSRDPEELDYDIKEWINGVRYQKESTIDSLLEGKGETFTKEDVAKLSSPVSPPAPTPTADEELSKSEKRKKEREDKKSAKEKAKSEKKEQDLESKKEVEKKPGKLVESAKSALGGLKENSGKIIEGGVKLGESLISKNVKNPELKKAAEAGLKEAKGLLTKSADKSKSVSTVTPLKSPTPKPAESQEKKMEIQSQDLKKEETGKNAEASPGGSPGAKTENKKESGSEKSPSKGETNMSKADIDEMKSALFRIASLLEGTLSVSPIESPYRPNSKRI